MYVVVNNMEEKTIPTGNNSITNDATEVLAKKILVGLERQGTTTIEGNLILEQDRVFEGNLLVKGNIISKPSYKNSLTVKGNISANEINCVKTLSAKNIDAGDTSASEIYAIKIYVRELCASSIDAREVIASSINADHISAESVSSWGPINYSGIMASPITIELVKKQDASDSGE
jgi:hypothetical protein